MTIARANITQTEQDAARQLARAVLRRETAQPIDLSSEEARALALAVLFTTRPDERMRLSVGSDDAIENSFTNCEAAVPDEPLQIDNAETISMHPPHDVAGTPLAHLEYLAPLLWRDFHCILKKDREYAASWKARGGVGAFMMLARKWDRLEPQAARAKYDIFEAIRLDERPEGIIDDIRDLRRYLALVEAECVRRGYVTHAEIG